MKYQVQISYTNPAHDHVTLRRRVETITRLVEASTEGEALNRAANQQRALGFIIREAKVIESAAKKEKEQLEEVQLNEEVEQVKEGAKEDAAELLGGPVKTKPKMPPGKRSPGSRYVRGLARKAMKAGMKKEEVEQIDEISPGLARKAAAASQLKAIEFSGYSGLANLYNKEGKKEGNRLDRKSDKAMDYIGKRQGQKGVDKVNRMVTRVVGEEVEQIDELKKSTLVSYVGKAAGRLAAASRLQRDFEKDGNTALAGEFEQSAQKKKVGIQKAANKLAKEEVGADKRDAGYKMSPAVRKAQAESDRLSKVEKPVQAGTLAAQRRREAMKKEEVNLSEQEVINNKKSKAADTAKKMVNAAKGKMNKINLDPKVDTDNQKTQA